MVWLKTSARSPFTYYNDDEKTSGAHRGDYYTLGDMGYLDDDGFLFLTDRTANLIITGGVNVYPAEVDAVLLEHPAVADAATIGIPDDEWGESVLAVVELKPEYAASAALSQDLLTFCRDRLAHFKCPRAVEFTTTLPRQDNGKIYKRRLRDDYRSAPDRPAGCAPRANWFRPRSSAPGGRPRPVTGSSPRRASSTVVPSTSSVAAPSSTTTNSSRAWT